jgi:hypothetical protein
MSSFISIKCIPNQKLSNDKIISFDVVWYGAEPLKAEIKMEISCERKRMRDRGINFEKNTENYSVNGHNSLTVNYKLYPKF